MFDARIKVTVAQIMVNAAMAALADPTTDRLTSEQVLVDGLRYFDALAKDDQILVRQKAIYEALKSAPRVEVTEERQISTVERDHLKALVHTEYRSSHIHHAPVRTDYAAPILRKLKRATEIAALASDREEFFAIIEVSKTGVCIAQLPWMWGFFTYAWQFTGKNRQPGYREILNIMTK
jgi:hypothetical protein